MSEKRKDHKGRLLRTGESQRKDLTYQFRYTDVTGKRRTFYAKDLKELRKQEEKIQREVDAGVNYCEGNINVIELVDGYTGFLLLDKNGNPKVGLHLDHHMQWTMKKYRRTRSEPLPTITPHVLRHTFCTNMANGGMDLKSLQYLMGHSDAGITMNVYTHASFAQAEKSMQKILRFEPEKEAKTG